MGHWRALFLPLYPVLPDHFQASSAMTTVAALAWCTHGASRENEDYQPFDRLRSETSEI
jgi:hypothetical protein